jgi:MOSC domain-containing protein YiiM
MMPMKDSAVARALFVGKPKEITDSKGTWISSIYRDPVVGSIPVTKSGLEGDAVTQPMHGGPDKAICVHLTDHYRFWNAKYGVELQDGGVGENVTLDGITEDEVCVGDIVLLGTALIQVSSPRIPCGNQARRVGRKDWVKLTRQECRTGFYLRVLEEGTLQAGDFWSLQERIHAEGTIPAINRCMYLEFDPEYAQQLLAMDALDQWWKERIRKKAEELAEQTALKIG